MAPGDPGASTGEDRRTGPDRSRSRPGIIARAARTAGYATVTAVALIWVAGVHAGIVYWALQGWTWGAILSAVVPFFGAVSIVASLLNV